MTVDLTTCGMESALMVLLAWACSFSQALQQGAKFEVKEVILSVGDFLGCLCTSQASCCVWTPHSDRRSVLLTKHQGSSNNRMWLAFLHVSLSEAIAGVKWA